MAFRAVIIKDGAVGRYDVSGPASEVHIVRGEAGEVIVRVYDRESGYGGSGAARELNGFQLSGPGEAVRVVFEESRSQ